MRILRFIDSTGRTQWGIPIDDRHAAPIIGGLFGSFTVAGSPAEIVCRLAPVTPPNICGVGRNYREHAAEMTAEPPPTEPLIFLKATTSVIGPDESIILPASAPDEVDYEGELAVVIGRRVKNVPESTALDCVFGYTCANDVTARDCQHRRDQQWTRGKSFDTFCPLGPVIVTRDEFDPADVSLCTTLNGRVMQQASTRDMIFSVPALVAYLSHQFTLLPGTVILTGTPAGVGAARKPPVFLRAGDEVAVEIPGIGRLANRVIAAE